MGKSRGKGYEDALCRVCGLEEESLEHILSCIEARKTIKEEIVSELDRWMAAGSERSLRERLDSKIGRKISLELCNYTKEFEKLVKEKGAESIRIED